ncbi:P-selectin [Pteronotus mesoamericanus]|uniref:P-selectin n=1 Tax=Pteronotus mesoamericanus TaxID=1884717 RepID=UPI0023EB9EDC|nr:P-selectin [Pteronotus parnellii mesoamericanus]
MHQDGVAAWTYHYSRKSYSWNASRKFCQQYFTDLVAIQNKGEIAYLNDVLPYDKDYYWIGIRKIGNKWTWVGTGKALTKEAENWADNEPNNKRNNQDCVEIYIKSQSAPGKWNDEPCMKRKRALCYKASCQDASCSQRGECIETIGNYTCSCHPGFHGPECEYVRKCGAPELPQRVLMNCSHPLEDFSFKSQCSFHCAEGYALNGTRELECLASGAWSSKPPQCVAIPCPPLRPPEQGSVRCLHAADADPHRPSCSFSCEEGSVLVGPELVQCTALGVWTAPPPMCRAIACAPLESPAHGSMQCSPSSRAFRYNASCSFHCAEGFVLSGADTVRCAAVGRWTAPAPVCQAITCAPLLSPQNGTMTCVQPLGRASYKSTCQFTCNEGFSLFGPERLDCTPSGHWTGPPPTCEAVRCPELLAPVSGSMDCSGTRGGFTVGATCRFSCAEGFRLEGSHDTQCTASGRWTAPPSACEAVKCSELHITEPILMNCSNPWGHFSYGSTCTFHCPEGQLLNGSGRTACQHTGQWSAAVPACQDGSLTVQEALTYFGGAVASATGLAMGGTLLALLRRRCRQKDDGKSPLNTHSHLGTYGVFTNAAFDPSP